MDKAIGPCLPAFFFEIQPGRHDHFDVFQIRFLADFRKIVQAIDIAAIAIPQMNIQQNSIRGFLPDGGQQVINARVARINPSAAAGSRAVLVYLAIDPQASLRHGLFAQGHLTVGRVKTLALPLSAVRTDKPQPYVQLVSQNQVQHVNVGLGERGEADGITMVALTGLPEGGVVIDGTVGSLRAGTLVNTTAVAAGNQ